ncbi:MAG: ArsA-related P-loop ATPase [Myxococcota bacterium]|nr:hypothetical protein [Myxococcales bacterium]MEC7751881.1 ArsA-related P-loop ATPase [Myxococcota bacterium]
MTQRFWITGKGGVGKTTLAEALAALLSRHGAVEVVEFDGERSVSKGTWGHRDVTGKRSISAYLGHHMGPLRALLGTPPGQAAISLLNAAPLVGDLTGLWWLHQVRDRAFQVVDLPASGHAAGFLRSRRAARRMARVGPIARLVERMDLRGPMLLVTLAEPLASQEAIELADQLSVELGRDPHRVVCNRVLPQAVVDALDHWEDCPLKEDLLQRADMENKALAQLKSRFGDRLICLPDGQAVLERLEAEEPWNWTSFSAPAV